MSILVTGGAGFIGSHLTRALVDLGETVVVADRRSGSLRMTGPNASAMQPNVVRENVDILDSRRVAEVLERHKVDRIVHLAYLLPPATEDNPAAAIAVNCEGMNQILSLALEHGVGRVVWTSSMAVYGPAALYGDSLVGEDAAVGPTSVYGGCKVLMEQVCRTYSQKGLRVIGLRFNAVYGPGRVHGHGNFRIWTRDMVEHSHRGIPVSVPSADTELDWIYVSDAARALIHALRTPKEGHLVYNILGYRAPVRDVASIIEELLPRAQISLEAGQPPATERFPVFGSSRALSELEFTPTHDLHSGLSAYVHFLDSLNA